VNVPRQSPNGSTGDCDPDAGSANDYLSLDIESLGRKVRLQLSEVMGVDWANPDIYTPLKGAMS